MLQDSLTLDLAVIGNNGHPPRARCSRLAIVGNHSATRGLAPFDDPSWEIWTFNEAPQKTEIYKRWDADFQLHRPEVYTSLANWVNKDHWEWLQQEHGPGKRIFMIDVDPRVPNSVKYPLDEVLSLVPYNYLRSSPAMALALAIYLGYERIALYGSELTSNTEYTYQAVNYAFWIGFAHGRGVKLELQCWQSEFWQPIYGFEGEAQVSKDLFMGRFAEHERAWKANENILARIKERMDQAMLEAKFERVGELTSEMQLAAMAAGEASGAMAEAERYSKRTNPISRQEFERVSAKAHSDGDEAREKMWHAGGKCEYVWNVWKQTGNLAALNQLRIFLREKTQFAYDTGAKIGIFNENILYMGEYDKLVTALGGERALTQMKAVENG